MVVPSSAIRVSILVSEWISLEGYVVQTILFISAKAIVTNFAFCFFNMSKNDFLKESMGFPYWLSPFTIDMNNNFKFDYNKLLPGELFCANIPIGTI